MIYLASPYTHNDPTIEEHRYEAIARFTVAKLTEGYCIYSPIVHCHILARTYGLPAKFDFWMQYNFRMLRLAQSLWVVRLPGWDISKGVQAEIQFAQAAYIPIQYWDI